MDAQETNSEISTTSCLWRLVSCPNLIEKQFPNSFVVYLHFLPNNVFEAIKKQIYVTQTIVWKILPESNKLRTVKNFPLQLERKCWEVQHVDGSSPNRDRMTVDRSFLHHSQCRVQMEDEILSTRPQAAVARLSAGRRYSLDGAIKAPAQSHISIMGCWVGIGKEAFPIWCLFSTYIQIYFVSSFDAKSREMNFHIHQHTVTYTMIIQQVSLEKWTNSGQWCLWPDGCIWCKLNWRGGNLLFKAVWRSLWFDNGWSGFNKSIATSNMAINIILGQSWVFSRHSMSLETLGNCFRNHRGTITKDNCESKEFPGQLENLKSGL